MPAMYELAISVSDSTLMNILICVWIAVGVAWLIDWLLGKAHRA